MPRCPTCSAPSSPDSRFCGRCGAALSPTSAATETSVPGSAPTPPGTRPARAGGAHGIFPGIASLPSDAQFVPGRMLAGRYRIVGLLGRGGMGEVYRADDVKLGQPVALKFLPPALAQHPGRLERFLNEVRVARQVSHANVCRVYDVGEAEGQHFLSMEYVDGEELGSLLRRIGRPEPGKAAQIARQICAGLAAAHARGIVHRDLKPANVMVDGRGQVRITDFGLAGLAASITGDEIRAGTPDYMAPEQLDGREVSDRSDLYALGLVLYELFTGRPAFAASATLPELRERRRASAPASPSTVVPGVDDAVERVILRCLDPDPARRPASALAVAAALPGGDPLAAALEAGETPSPEMVAAAGPEGGLRPGSAVALLVVVLAGLPLLASLVGGIALYGRVPLEWPASALAARAQSVVADLGWTAPAVDRVSRFAASGEVLRRLARDPHAPAALDDPFQQALGFQYRQGSRWLAPDNPSLQFSAHEPEPEPGDVFVRLDPRGDLRELLAIPPAVAPEAATVDREPMDWSPLFRAAGLDSEAFEPVAARLRPLVSTDARGAWRGTPEGTRHELRVEAGAIDGKPVFFQVLPATDPRWSDAPPDPGAGGAEIVLVVLLSVVTIGGLVLAIHNRRRGRGDARGARRVALFVVTVSLLQWAFGGHHVPALAEQFNMTFVALGRALVLASLAWVGYLAIEPWVRRLWPQVLVSWSRLLAGRLGDALVGRDLLIGFVAGIAFLSLTWAGQRLPTWLTGGAAPPLPWGLGGLPGGRHAVAAVLAAVLVGLSVAILQMVLFLLLRIVLRRQWIAAAAFVLLFAAITVLQLLATAAAGGPAALWVGTVLLSAAAEAFVLVLLLRFGLVAAVGAFVLVNLVARLPMTLDPSRPYFATSLVGLLVAAGLAVWAFRTALAGRAVFGDLLAD